MKTNNTMRIGALAVGIVAALSSQAKAQVEPGAVGIGGETLFVLKAPMDLDKSIKSRSDDVYDRIRFVLNNPKLRASDIKVKALGDYGYKIVANGQLIVPIGEKEAEAHGMTMMELANDWAVRLKKVLPKLNAKPDLFALRYKAMPQRAALRR